VAAATRAQRAAAGRIGCHQPGKTQQRQGNHHHVEQLEQQGEAQSPNQLGSDGHQSFSGWAMMANR
jgi:hypothetical protein